MPVILDFLSAGWAQWVMVILLLEQKCIQGKPIMNKFLQPMLVSWAKVLQGTSQGAPLHQVTVTVLPIEFAAETFVAILGHGCCLHLGH